MSNKEVLRGRPPQHVHILSWMLALDKDGVIPCPFKNCTFMATTFNEMFAHYYLFKCGNDFPFICDECQRATDDEMILLFHKMFVHAHPVSEETKKAVFQSVSSRYKINPYLKKGWELYLENKGFIKCLNPACLIITESLAEMEQHYRSNCTEEFWMTSKLICPTCEGRFFSLKDMNDHIKRFHKRDLDVTSFKSHNLVGGDMVEQWKKEIMEKKEAYCPVPGCKFVDNKIRFMEDHYKTCNGKVKGGYSICSICFRWLGNADKVDQHKKCVHKDYVDNPGLEISLAQIKRGASNSSREIPGRSDDLFLPFTDEYSSTHEPQVHKIQCKPQTKPERIREAIVQDEYSSMLRPEVHKNYHSQYKPQTKPVTIREPIENTSIIDDNLSSGVGENICTNPKNNSSISKIKGKSIDARNTDDLSRIQYSPDTLSNNSFRVEQSINADPCMNFDFNRQSNVRKPTKKTLPKTNVASQPKVSQPLPTSLEEVARNLFVDTSIPVKVNYVDDNTFNIDFSDSATGAPPLKDSFPLDQDSMFKALRKDAFCTLEQVAGRSLPRNDTQRLFKPRVQLFQPKNITIISKSSRDSSLPVETKSSSSQSSFLKSSNVDESASARGCSTPFRLSTESNVASQSNKSPKPIRDSIKRKRMTGSKNTISLPSFKNKSDCIKSSDFRDEPCSFISKIKRIGEKSSENLVDSNGVVLEPKASANSSKNVYSDEESWMDFGFDGYSSDEVLSSDLQSKDFQSEISNSKELSKTGNHEKLSDLSNNSQKNEEKIDLGIAGFHSIKDKESGLGTSQNIRKKRILRNSSTLCTKEQNSKLISSKEQECQSSKISSSKTSELVLKVPPPLNSSLSDGHISGKKSTRLNLADVKCTDQTMKNLEGSLSESSSEVTEAIPNYLNIPPKESPHISHSGSQISSNETVKVDNSKLKSVSRPTILKSKLKSNVFNQSGSHTPALLENSQDELKTINLCSSEEHHLNKNKASLNDNEISIELDCSTNHEISNNLEKNPQSDQTNLEVISNFPHKNSADRPSNQLSVSQEEHASSRANSLESGIKSAPDSSNNHSNKITDKESGFEDHTSGISNNETHNLLNKELLEKNLSSSNESFSLKKKRGRPKKNISLDSPGLDQKNSLDVSAISDSRESNLEPISSKDIHDANTSFPPSIAKKRGRPPKKKSSTLVEEHREIADKANSSSTMNLTSYSQTNLLLSNELQKNKINTNSTLEDPNLSIESVIGPKKRGRRKKLMSLNTESSPLDTSKVTECELSAEESGLEKSSCIQVIKNDVLEKINLQSLEPNSNQSSDGGSTSINLPKKRGRPKKVTSVEKTEVSFLDQSGSRTMESNLSSDPNSHCLTNKISKGTDNKSNLLKGDESAVKKKRGRPKLKKNSKIDNISSDGLSSVVISKYVDGDSNHELSLQGQSRSTESARESEEQESNALMECSQVLPPSNSEHPNQAKFLKALDMFQNSPPASQTNINDLNDTSSIDCEPTDQNAKATDNRCYGEKPLSRKRGRPGSKIPLDSAEESLPKLMKLKSENDHITMDNASSVNSDIKAEEPPSNEKSFCSVDDSKDPDDVHISIKVSSQGIAVNSSCNINSGYSKFLQNMLNKNFPSTPSGPKKRGRPRKVVSNSSFNQSSTTIQDSIDNNDSNLSIAESLSSSFSIDEGNTPNINSSGLRRGRRKAKRPLDYNYLYFEDSSGEDQSTDGKNLEIYAPGTPSQSLSNTKRKPGRPKINRPSLPVADLSQKDSGDEVKTDHRNSHSEELSENLEKSKSRKKNSINDEFVLSDHTNFDRSALSSGEEVSFDRNNDECHYDGEESSVLESGDCSQAQTKQYKRNGRPRKEMFLFDSYKEEPDKQVVCVMCKESMSNKDFRTKHLRKHNFFTWAEGDEPLPVNELSAMLRILARGLKLYPGLVLKCELCGKKCKASVTFFNHYQICGKEPKKPRIEYVEAPPKIETPQKAKPIPDWKKDMGLDLFSKAHQNPRRERQLLLQGRIDCSTVLQDKDAMVKCAVCGETMQARKYQKSHLLKHNFIAWLEGEDPLPVNDYQLLLNLLNKGKKVMKLNYFTCEICGKNTKSAGGFISHRATCGRSEEEKTDTMVACVYCGRMMLPFSIPTHMYQAHRNEQQNAEEQNADLEQKDSKKRATAIKCLDKLADFIGEEEVGKGSKDDDLVIEESLILEDSPRSFRGRSLFKVARGPTRLLKVLWLRKEENNEMIHCPLKSPSGACDFVTLSYREITNHYQSCTFNPQNSRCQICGFFDKDKELMRAHISTCTKDSLEQQAEDYLLEDTQGKMYIPYIKKMELTENFKNTVILRKSIPWTKEVRDKNFEKEPIYSEFESTEGNWEGLDDSENKDYKPEGCNSIPVMFGKGDWADMRTFEGRVLEGGKEGIGYTGGPIVSMAWCPSVGQQYLAVATHLSFNESLPIGFTSNKPGLIQIWTVGNVKNTMNSGLECMEFTFGLCHDDSSVWSMAWCPAGGESQTRLGLLAAATSSGNIPIYAIPQPKGLPLDRTRFFKMKPSLTLDYPSNEKCQCSTIAWSKLKPHRTIAAGFVNGVVCVWDLTCTSSLLRSSSGALRPHKVFNAHNSYVSGICLSPENENILCTVSFDRQHKFWDVRDTSSPLSTTSKGILRSADWLTSWMMATTSLDVGYLLSTTTTTAISSLRGFVHSMGIINGINSSSMDVSANDWLNAVASSYENGQVIISFLHKHMQTGHHRDHKRINKTVLKGELVDIQHGRDGQDSLPSCSSSSPCGLRIKTDLAVRSFEGSNVLRTNLKGANVDVEPLSAITRVAWNTNPDSFTYLASGFQAGFIVISKLGFPPYTHNLLDSTGEAGYKSD